jgi:hypothetical protein
MNWYDEARRIYLTEYTGKIEITEIEDALISLAPLLDAGPIYMLTDTRHANLPINMVGRKQMASFFRHPNLKFVATIQDNLFIQYAAQLLGQGKVGVYATREQAIEAIYNKLNG